MSRAEKAVSGEDSRKEQIDLLEKQYSVLRNETLLQIQSGKTHVKNSQIVITGALSIIAFLLNTPTSYALSPNTALLWLLFTLLSSTVTFYLFFTAFEALHTINVLGEYLASIERRINSLVKMRVMIWESEIAEKAIGSPLPFKGVISPNSLISIYPSLAVFAITIIFPLYVYCNIWQWWTEISPRIVLVLCSLYSIGSFVLSIYVLFGTFYRLRNAAREFIEKAWEES